MNRRIQMRQNNVDFQNRELPTNILALLLVTTRRPQSEWRLGDTVLSPEQSGRLCPAALQQLSDDDWSAAA
jgi:ssRNA-specific RNase YbeY (16S rRNA maturation enzyme)